VKKHRHEKAIISGLTQHTTSPLRTLTPNLVDKDGEKESSKETNMMTQKNQRRLLYTMRITCNWKKKKILSITTFLGALSGGDKKKGITFNFQEQMRERTLNSNTSGG
jgi:hypothetical protein